MTYRTAELCFLIFIVSFDKRLLFLKSGTCNFGISGDTKRTCNFGTSIVKGLELSFIIIKNCAHAPSLSWGRPCERPFQSLVACGWCLLRGAWGEIWYNQCPSIFMIKVTINGTFEFFASPRCDLKAP